jgi:DNA-binding Xre family transcriptional regulator
MQVFCLCSRWVWYYNPLPMATVRLTVKELAEKRGISNPFMLAKETGLNYAACYKMWHGEQQRVDLKTLAKLCEIFSVKPGQLFEYKPD